MSHSTARVCNLCEAMCGLIIQHDNQTITSITAHAADVFSAGAYCPKSQGLGAIQRDPDRLRQPLKRTAKGFEPIAWEQAFSEISDRVNALQELHGRHTVATYLGNPNVHNTGSLLTLPLFLRAIGSVNKFSATSVDQLPHQLMAYLMFGHQLLLPIADVDRTQYMLILGANPVVSNGSLLSAPGLSSRLKAIQKRGGKVVVLDPRYTETASLATTHHFIRPGTDSTFLAALLARLMARSGPRLGHLAEHVKGLDLLLPALAQVQLDELEAVTGVTPATLEGIVDDFLAADGAVCYGRMGLSTQSDGTLCQWLINCINILTGNFDRPGGAMFTLPAVDIIQMMARSGQRGSFARRRSRVRGLPEANGEFPAATLADEILTPGEGQVRALFTVAGNPVLSLPNGRKLEAALSQLELFVAIDFYQNESSSQAHYILPPTTTLEHSHYDLVFNALAVRNVVRYSAPILAKPADSRHDWEILLELWSRIGAQKSLFNRRPLLKMLLQKLGIDTVIDIGLRTGPYRRQRLSLKKVRAAAAGIDLGPLQPCLPGRLFNREKKIDLFPAQLQTAWQEFQSRAPILRDPERWQVIGRRNLRSNNSWMHNSAVPQQRHPCFVMMHSADAARHGIREGMNVRVSSEVGAIELPVQLSERIMPGVVSIPHGWGHHRAGASLSKASVLPGVSLNDITDDSQLDRVSGNAALNGQLVTIAAVGP